ARFGEQAKNCKVGVGLDGVTDAMRLCPEGIVVSAKAVDDGAFRIHVSGSAGAADDIGERRIVTTERVVAIRERPFHQTTLYTTRVWSSKMGAAPRKWSRSSNTAAAIAFGSSA